jgi:lipopolysaccharide export system protein LptA
MKTAIKKTGWWNLILVLAGVLALLLLTPGWAGAITRSVPDLVVDGGDTFIVPPSITYNFETIGGTGQGSLQQFSGSNTANLQLTLGDQATGSGTYQLFSGSLMAPGEFIGGAGIGSFKQFGGTNSASFLFLGDQSTASGIYQLFGGSLSVSNNEYIGREGSGGLTQFGGRHTVGNILILADLPGSRGSYNLSVGSLTAFIEVFGHNGTASFSQFGGTNTATNFLSLGTGSGSGTYHLYSGHLSAPDEIIAESGTGSFRQIGGIHAITNNLFLGSETGSSGAYNLTSGNLMVSKDEIIGNEGTGSFTHTSGNHTVNGDLTLGKTITGNGTYNIKSGNLTVAGNEYIGYDGTGVVNQSGGKHTVAATGGHGGGGGFISGFGGNGGDGTYNLKAGQLSVDTDEIIGVEGTGTFIHTSGNHTVNGDLTLGKASTGRGTYNLKGGNLTVDAGEIIGQFGAGIFTQTGGKHTVAGTLTLARQPLSRGTYNLQGGQLTAGTIRIGDGGTFNVLNTFTKVTGDVVDEGMVKTTKATVTWNGSFINAGAYISDHASQTFIDLTVVSPPPNKGYFRGASQDLFIIKNDFINKSTNTTDWDTAAATLKFVTGVGWDTDHDFYIPGADNGMPGDVSVTALPFPNFALGTLNIFGQTVHLFDGNTGNTGSAQYVGGLMGAALSGLDVTNISADELVNIYYDPDLLVNFYLHGLTYNLAGTGGGQLIPFHTPLPPSALLLGSGLLGLGLLGWRRKRG